MAETNLDELKERIDTHVADLQRAQKQLQKPSTLSFVDRRDLTTRAGKALTELREHRAALDGKSDGDEGLTELLTEVEAALERSDKVLNKSGAGQGKGPQRTAGGSTRGAGGATTRAAGASQTRPPDRRGGE